MITVWISASLLALTGWQGYRLGKEYGWWAKRSPAKKKEEIATATPFHKIAESEGNGLGRSKTDFGRLLDGFAPVNRQSEQSENRRVDEDNLEQPIIEPATTLMQVDETGYGTDYPEETDQIPETCSWMDEEDISLVEVGSNEGPNNGQGEVALGDYVKRVRTVQRKMTQLTNRRKADTTFVKQELGLLIATYQLENDQSLEWLFQQHELTTQTDYGSLYDRIESLTA